MFNDLTPKQISESLLLSEATIRTWLNRSDPLRTTGLTVGKHRRYDFADAMRFRLLSDLVFNFDVNASEAISTINRYFDDIATVARVYLVGVADRGPWITITDKEKAGLPSNSPGQLMDKFLGARGEGATIVLVIDLGLTAMATAGALSRPGVLTANENEG